MKSCLYTYAVFGPSRLHCQVSAQSLSSDKHYAGTSSISKMSVPPECIDGEEDSPGAENRLHGGSAMGVLVQKSVRPSNSILRTDA